MTVYTPTQIFRLLLLGSIFGVAQVHAHGAGMADEPGWSKQSGGPAILLPGDVTGAPGSAGICADCHDELGTNGGPFQPVTTTISVSGSPSAYVPGNNYTITIRSQTGATPAGYGFQMVVLENGGNTNTGTLSNNSPAATHITACAAANIPGRCQAGRIFFEHEYADTAEVMASGNTWTVTWTAPAAGTGSITIYAISNAVDANGNRNGDSPAPTNKSLSLTEQAATIAFTAIGPFSIDENRGFGSVVGDVDASLGGGAADAGLTYSVVGGTGSAAFSIDSATGLIKVLSGPLLDFETSSSFTLVVQASDGGSTQSSVTVTINLNNLNDNAPVFTSSGPFAVATDASNGDTVGNVNANDGDLGSSDSGISYSITGGSGSSAFSINGSSGVITVLDASQLTGGSLTLDVQADDGTFQTTATITIIIGGSGFVINQGIAAAWQNDETGGRQGFLIDINPVTQFMFLAWFTFDDNVDKVGSPDQRWLVAAGIYTGNSADLDLFRVSGGVFDTEPDANNPVLQPQDGTMTISFSDCENGLIEYDLPNDGVPMGQIDIVRAVPGTEVLCQDLLAANKLYEQSVAAGAVPEPLAVADDLGTELNGHFEFNQGIAGSWYEPATEGQGILIDVNPFTQFVFMAWFTFEAADSNKVGSGEQRWMIGFGIYEGGGVELELISVAGGLFDDPQDVVNTTVGSMTLTFSDCETGLADYNLTSEGLFGQIDIIRLLDAGDLCRSLAAGKQKE